MINNFELVALIPALFLVPLLPYIRKFFDNNIAAKLAYGAATSGILLTFYGIWIGLLGFDFSNIENSLPSLLDGLKTSFGSSIVGLTTSMLINLFFVRKEETEDDLEKIIRSMEELNRSLNNFAKTSSDAQVAALASAVKSLIDELEMGINSETKEVMTRFRDSVDFLRKWQEKYVDEIKSVTDAMDKNAKVTSATSEQLDRTNDVLDQLAPVTEKIAQSIGWVQRAIPTTRPRGVAQNSRSPDTEDKSEE